MKHYPRASMAVVIDDHALFVDSFCALLERLELFAVVRAEQSRKELFQFLVQHQEAPIVVFLDYYLENANALHLMMDIKRVHRKARIIMLSSVTAGNIVASIMLHKPYGFVSKASGTDEVILCVNKVLAGQEYVCPVIREILASVDDRSLLFTKREFELLPSFALGLTIQQTAEKHNLSKHTVISHRRNMMAKAGAKTITELLSYARRLNYIDF